MTKDTTDWAVMTCSCGRNFTSSRVGGIASQFCPRCRSSDEQRKIRGAARLEHEIKERGRQHSTANKSRFTEWMGRPEPVLAHAVSFSMTFTPGFSKNRMHIIAPGGVQLRKEAREIKAAIAWRTKLSIKGHPFYRAKVWLDILVQKPGKAFDAVNVVDLICDGVKVGLGIDDRWFSLRRVDWEIVRENPMIYIGIGQEVTEDHFICLGCGIVRPERDQSTRKNVCVDCRGATDRPAPMFIPPLDVDDDD